MASDESPMKLAFPRLVEKGCNQSLMALTSELKQGSHRPSHDPLGYVYLKIDHSFTTHELMISCEPTSAEEWEGIRAWLVRDGQVAFGGAEDLSLLCSFPCQDRGFRFSGRRRGLHI